MSLAAMTTGQFNDSYDPIIDGVAIVTHNYARLLNRKYGPGYAVTVATPGSSDGSYGDDPPVLRYRSVPLPTRKPYRFGLPSLDPAFQERLASIRFDIVHAHNPFVAGRLALRTARSLGIPIVATFHTKYRDDFRRIVRSDRVALAIARRFSRFYDEVDAVWTVSEATIEVLREYGYRGSVEVMPNGCDLEPPADREPLRRRIEAASGVAAGDFVLLYVGQLVWEKNLRLVLDALLELARRSRRFRMFFVGEGYAEAAMKAFVDRNGLSDLVRFAGRVQDRERLKEFYARADLLLFPSMYDMSSLVQREAAAFSLPVVFVQGATTASQVRDDENGFLAPKDAGAFAARVACVMDHPATIRRAGEGAFRAFHRPWERVVDEVALRYRSIIERYARASGAV